MLVSPVAMSSFCGFSRLGWLCSLLVFGIAIQTAFGQPFYANVKPTVFDAYGNAGASGRERRLIGSFTTNTQRDASRGLQGVGRRVSPRGFGSIFALPSDTRRLGRTLPGAGLTPGFNALRSRSPRRSPAGFTRYGGFQRRGIRKSPDDLARLLRRPQMLTAATAGIAPVHRAPAGGSSSLGMLRAVVQVPFIDIPRDEAAEQEQATLYEQLRAGIRRSYDQARENGWRYFEEGSYHRAARSFEAAVMIESQDFESRAGVVVSYLALGAMRTSLASLVSLNARETNPFTHDLDLAAHFPTEMSARKLRLQTQLYSQAHSGAEVARALHSFLLWYLGAREEAMLAARPLAHSQRKTPFASWPSKMAAAMEATNSGSVDHSNEGSPSD